MKHLQSHPPDKDWLINVIGLVNPEHEIFAKGYIPPKEEKPRGNQPSIPDHQGFFDGLPRTKSKGRLLRINLAAGREG